MAQRYPVSAVQGNRFVGAAVIKIGTGGMPTSVAGYPGLSVTRGQTGQYSMAFPVLRDVKVNYTVQVSPSLAYIRGTQLQPRASGILTGIGQFFTCDASGRTVDGANGDEITVWFYASESDAS